MNSEATVTSISMLSFDMWYLELGLPRDAADDDDDYAFQIVNAVKWSRPSQIVYVILFWFIMRTPKPQQIGYEVRVFIITNHWFCLFLKDIM